MVQPPQQRSTKGNCFLGGASGLASLKTPRSRSSWKLEDREELQALNWRFEPAEAAHSFSTSYCFSVEMIEHVAHRTFCTLLRNWGAGVRVSPWRNLRFLCDPFLYVCFQLLISGGPSAPHIMFHTDGCHVSRKRLLLCRFVHFNYWCDQPTAHTCCRTTALDVVARDAVVSMLCFSTQDWLFAPWHWSRGELCEWVWGFFFTLLHLKTDVVNICLQPHLQRS